MREKITFNNEFDLTCEELNVVAIRENHNKDNCMIWNTNDSTISYNAFILIKNSRSKTICETTFYKSSITNKYIPRLTFKRLFLDGKDQDSKNPEKISISFGDSDSAETLWKLIAFLSSYKDLVDVGEFDSTYKIVPKESYIIDFKSKGEREKIEELKELISIANLSSSDIKTLTFHDRKKNLKAFYYLLKNKTMNDGTDSHSHYKNKFNLKQGEESIWHHFLKNHDWILGLNADLKFFNDFLNEQQVGNPNSKGSGSPKTDLLGVSDFTVLIELKHTNTPIFKKEKSKGRANTWDFTADFIEGISQCLGQKFELEESFNSKDFVKDDGRLLDKSQIQSVDPKSILLIGNKKEEFPIINLEVNNILKNKTLERFRRNNRNIDVLTYDELFERAYHIVYSKKLNSEWYLEDERELFE